MNTQNHIHLEIENKYIKIKAQNQARKQRFIQRKKELGYNHISSLWVHLDSAHTEILKEKLKNASTEELLNIVNFLSDRMNSNNRQEDNWSTNTLLKNDLINYIRLKQISKKKESLNQLSIRLMEMGVSTESIKAKRKTRLSTSSLSRMIRKIEYEMQTNN